MNENNRPIARQNNVRLPNQIFPMKPKSEPSRVEQLTDNDFWSSVFALNCRHGPTPLLGRQDIHGQLARLTVVQFDS